MDRNQTRLIGDYIVGQRLGSGSFAVVWKARHRQSVPSTTPNIIRFFEAIETEDKFYLVLEYCDGGDLAAYIQRHRKVSEAVARHFMRQLAAGLQVLQLKHLIHRDLKPQNLLLSTNEETPVLKIGDFGFARSLTPQDLADTLCGSPLYMAPEIIQNQKYDAKADLWSVGAILFQLVTGKPPFDGNNQLQLFQNVLTSTELRFPPGALEELHPDCVDLCRSLLCQNPVERITFKEFFNHKFLEEQGQTVDAEWTSLVPETKPMVEHFNSSTFDDRPSSQSGKPMNSSSRNPKSACSSMHDKMLWNTKDQGNISSSRIVHDFMSNIACNKTRKSVDGQCSPDQLKDLMESIEKEYVIVNSHFASMDTFSFYLDASLQDNSTTKVSLCSSKKNEHLAVAVQTKDLPSASASGAESSQFHVSAPLQTSSRLNILKEVQGLSVLHPSTRLQLLHQYVHALTELAEEKYNAGLFLESFSVELVVLAIWKKALQICSSWLTSTSQSELPATSSANKRLVQGGTSSAPNSENNVDFSSLSSVCMWAEQGFILAFDRAEKLSSNIRDMDGAAEMPDAMEVIYQKALSLGKTGAVEEYMENKDSASALYSKAKLMLSFLVGEATSLEVYPPFSLTPSDEKRIRSYINNLQSRQS
ncbi:Kinase family protein [Melia azedarach]|uniref:Kinase family protein n=1 Tax=Melia azedarach TaxID=155640 RepID=A0ACC1YW11_MELAZ|nr:Kinase family protein [Melia azedarach]